MTFVSRFGLDGALYEAASPRRPGQIGRARLKGERLPNLSVLAQQASHLRRCARLGAKGVVDTGADLLLVACPDRHGKSPSGHRGTLDRRGMLRGVNG
jgi:hypothetical protein